ncbi:MAG: threonine synthase [Peptococcaceae bacterium BICA1-7]|nr:MAG: threonine synthase [Peptococcaceae bacterium BICA1-7]HBV99072.1 threonine synthase [Desulfotomaculum sp.]
MNYISTRGGGQAVSAAGAIKAGIAPDGGLYVPDTTVNIEPAVVEAMKNENYCSRAAYILPYYLTGYSGGEIADCVRGAYSPQSFDHPEVAPLVRLAEGTYVLELWHGPTSAFKDMALQILPRLLPLAVEKTGEKAEIVILVATSGDTGKAALEGFKDVPGTKIMVFFPDQGVSEVQRLQMITQEGGNVAVSAVKGNFDDAQSGVKVIFTDELLNKRIKEKGFKFSSANSINWGRLAPQIIYYFSAYLDLQRQGWASGGEPVNFVVPTGNFGNILAGFYARQAGLPIKRLICASNQNNVLTDFVKTGVYDRNRRFYRTLSPSMDILISSNLERLLFELSDKNPALVRGWMGDLKEKGSYSVGSGLLEKIQSLFWSGCASDRETMDTIKKTFDQKGYLADTHTAVGINVYNKYREATGDGTPTVILSTASPYKFNGSVARALLGEEAVAGKSEFELLEILSRASGTQIPRNLKDLDKKPVLHGKVVEREAMADAVEEFLGMRD